MRGLPSQTRPGAAHDQARVARQRPLRQTRRRHHRRVAHPRRALVLPHYPRYCHTTQGSAYQALGAVVGGAPADSGMANESGQQRRPKRARPSLQPPAVATGATKFSRSSSCGAAAPSQEPAASLSLSLGMVVLCAADVDRFRQGKGALTHPPPPTSPALKTHATFLCSARPSRRFGQLSSRAPPPRPHTPPTPSPQCCCCPC